MVQGSIQLTKDSEPQRSLLVIMQRDQCRRRGGYIVRSYIKALRKGLLLNYELGELFLHDNARIHTAEITQDQLNDYDVLVLDQPLYSPDLNLIKYMWLALKRKLYKLYSKFNIIGKLEEDQKRFKASLKEVQAAIPNKLISTLILSILDRLEAYRVAKGY